MGVGRNRHGAPFSRMVSDPASWVALGTVLQNPCPEVGHRAHRGAQHPWSPGNIAYQNALLCRTPYRGVYIDEVLLQEPLLGPPQFRIHGPCPENFGAKSIEAESVQPLKLHTTRSEAA